MGKVGSKRGDLVWGQLEDVGTRGPGVCEGMGHDTGGQDEEGCSRKEVDGALS